MRMPILSHEHSSLHVQVSLPFVSCPTAPIHSDLCVNRPVLAIISAKGRRKIGHTLTESFPTKNHQNSVKSGSGGKSLGYIIALKADLEDLEHSGTTMESVSVHHLLTARRRKN